MGFLDLSGRCILILIGIGAAGLVAIAIIMLTAKCVIAAMIFVSAISSFPRRRESRYSLLDPRLRGNDVYVVAECMIKAIKW